MDEHDDNDIQRNRYKEWVGVSVAEFGRLDLPPEELDNILPEAQKKTITRDIRRMTLVPAVVENLTIGKQKM